MLSRPKIIPLPFSHAITGERTLCFVPKEAGDTALNDTLQKVAASFSSTAPQGLPFRADADTLSITLVPTLGCNLRCVYCYSDGGQYNLSLSFESAKRAIDSLFDECPETTRANIFFAGGGEPFLCFPLIQQLVDYLGSKRQISQLRFVTNGTLVPQYIHWLLEHKAYIRISYDGAMQNATRPGRNFDSAVAVKATLAALRSTYPSDLVSIQMTVTRISVDHLAEDVCSIARDFGIKTFKVEPVQSSCSERSALVNSPEPRTFAESLLSTMDALVADDMGVFLDTSYLSVPSTEYFCSLRNKVVICPDGVISPCVEVTRRGVRDDLLLCDHLDGGGIDFQAVAKLQRQRFDRYHQRLFPVCAECNYVHFCKANCPMRLILAGESEGPFPYNCQIAKALIPKFLARADENEAYLRLVYGESFSAREECF